MRIAVRVDGLDSVIGAFAATNKQVVAASRVAINKTAKWASGQIAREIAQQNRVPLKALTKKGASQRIRARLADSRRPESASIWVGSKPIKASYVGALRQTRKGAKAGKWTFPGGFIATMKSGHRGIYKRSDKGRLPITEQTVSLATGTAIAASVNRRIPEYLRRRLQEELNYQVNVRGR